VQVYPVPLAALPTTLPVWSEPASSPLDPSSGTIVRDHGPQEGCGWSQALRHTLVADERWRSQLL
jgi:hypothetical protein